jgi:dihydrofolate synthase/folylpolyglutamate synthase
MSYSETIHYLYNLQKQGIKFGLNNIITLMSALENPHRSFPSIHIAGTNGKGSTSAIIASVLRTLGLKVGLFTSPHLVSFTERIRVNDEEITEYEVVNLAEEIRGKVSDLQFSDSNFTPTFFEVVTAIALLYFKRKRTDIAVIEVGMGGRLDATNIIIPEVSVITSISYDHREFLGSTLKEIAHEKTGIIKEGIPVVVSSQTSEVLEVIEAKAEEMNTKVYLYGEDFSSVLKREDISGIHFDYFDNDSFMIHDVYLPLTGEHQMQNASVAIKAVELFIKRLTSRSSFLDSHARLRSYFSPSPTPPIEGGKSQGATVEEGHIYEPSPLAGEGKGEGYHGFLSATWYRLIRDGVATTRWPGRLEMIKYEPPILIDGAHNAAAALALSHTLAKTFLGKYKRIILVLGIMGDKDIDGIMKPLLPLASEIILSSPNYERAASPIRLANVAASLGFPDVHIAPTVKDALELAKNICQQSNLPSPPSSLVTHHSSLIVVTGSFYTIGEAKEFVGHTGVLTRLRE